MANLEQTVLRDREGMSVEYKRATHPAVVARLHQAIQYSETSVMESRNCGVLNPPLEPVIGLAEGETRWRRMTAAGGAAPCINTPNGHTPRCAQPFAA